MLKPSDRTLKRVKPGIAYVMHAKKNLSHAEIINKNIWLTAHALYQTVFKPFRKPIAEKQLSVIAKYALGLASLQALPRVLIHKATTKLIIRITVPRLKNANAPSSYLNSTMDDTNAAVFIGNTST
jgi:hypothetical protein